MKMKKYTLKLNFILLFVFLVFGFFGLPKSSEATIFFSENWDNGTFGSFAPYSYPGDTCDCANPTQAYVDTTDLRSGASDPYAFHVVPPVGDFGCCVNSNGPQGFNFGANQGFYVIFWIKYSSQCRFDSGAGKMPEIHGPNGNRVIFTPGAFDESWNIPNPPYGNPPTNSYRTALIPVLYVETDPNRKSWPFNPSICTANGSSQCFGQNINTNNPIYIERGYWYRVKIYVLPKTAGGRYRVWLQKENSPEVEIIDTSQITDCDNYLVTLRNTNDHYSEFLPHFMYNDHGGAGSNSGFEYWVDDILITDNPQDVPPDTTPPASPTGVTVN